MSDNVSCPDCNSQDIQEKVKQLQKTTSGKNWKGFWFVLLIGFAVSVVCAVVAVLFQEFLNIEWVYILCSVIAGIAILGAIIVGPILLYRGSVKIQDESYKYYVCRSCGREFRKN